MMTRISEFLTRLINWLHKRLNNPNYFNNLNKNTNNTNGNITTFLELLTHLSRHQVRYILVGGLAVDFSGYSRATHDVDIIVEYSEININLLLSCLIDFGQGSAKELSYEDFDLEEGCIRIIEHYPLDIFTVMRGNLYQDLLQYVEIDNRTGISIPYLNAKGLIELKKESLRSKDKIDVQTLQSLTE
jgi:hypothetical protein